MTMPRVVGVCGLIGSGKSVVRRMLQIVYGCPSFDSDDEAKKLYFSSTLRGEMRRRLSIDPIRDGVIDKTLLHHCLQNPETRKELEEIVHSALEDRWHQWLSVQEAPVVVLESAILYTSGYHEFCDRIIAVTAPAEIRRARVLHRDGVERAERFESIEGMQVKERDLQMSRADHRIHNDGVQSVIRQVEELSEIFYLVE